MIVMMPIQHVRFYHLKLKTKTSQTNWENLCGWRGSMHLVCVMASVFFFIIQIIKKQKKQQKLTVLLWALTLKSGFGTPRSWCVCWSSARTLSPVTQEQRY